MHVMKNSTNPRENVSKVDTLLQQQGGYSDLYRTILAGPSGQRSQMHVARVAYHDADPWEMRIVRPSDGYTMGLARRADYDGTWWWSVTNQCPHTGAMTWIGYAQDLAVGADWCLNGHHAATGRHDSRRTGRAVVRTQQEVSAAQAQVHYEACVPCHTAYQRRGWMWCVATDDTARSTARTTARSTVNA